MNNIYRVNKDSLFSFFSGLLFFILIAAVIVSFIITVVVLEQLLGDSILLVVVVGFLVFVFEVFKASAAFLLKLYPDTKYAWLIAFVIVALVLVSGTSTGYLVSGRITNPNLEIVRQQDIAEVEKTLKRETDMLSLQTAVQVKAVQESTATRRKTVEDIYGKQLERLDKKLTAEMEITDKYGNFRGRRYRDLERRIKDTKKTVAIEFNRIAAQEQDALQLIRSSQDTRHTQITQEAQEKISFLQTHSYADDKRVMHQGMLAFRDAIGEVTGLHISYITIPFVLSLLLAVLLESIILIMSTHLARLLIPLLRSYIDYRDAVENEAAAIALKQVTTLSPMVAGVADMQYSAETIYRDLYSALHTFTTTPKGDNHETYHH